MESLAEYLRLRKMLSTDQKVELFYRLLNSADVGDLVITVNKLLNLITVIECALENKEECCCIEEGGKECKSSTEQKRRAAEEE